MFQSLLFVPADRPERFAKAEASGAGAVIFDLEDSVAAGRKDFARAAVAERMASPREGAALLVRVNPLGGARIDDDLDALAGWKLDGLLLPKAEGAASIRALADALGARCIDAPILPVATETPAAIFRLGEYAEVASRLLGLTWGAEDLPAAIGASTSREEDGGYTDPYRMVRSLTLFGAAAAGVAPIETVYPDIRDLEGLRAYAARGARDGFIGMMAIHPAQVPVIEEAMRPSEATIARAQAVVAAFAAAPGIGAIQLDGQMIDAPHRIAAERVLARAGLA
ncbi:HpcH/HpaI aldolase/citrate lyase family protein [Sphingomonas sp.]